MPQMQIINDGTPFQPTWSIRHAGTRATLSLGGSWHSRHAASLPTASEVSGALDASVTSLVISTSNLQNWGSALPALIYALQRQLPKRQIELNTGQLPADLLALLKLTERQGNGAPAPKRRPRPWIERVGLATLRCYTNLKDALATIASFLSGLRRMATGGARFRGRDLIVLLAQCGAQALPIITLVSLLVGSILAFVGAIQLQRFGAEIYIADLVGIAVAREMAAMMTAIVMAGRTGAAFAAHLATMQVNEEIDALKTLGLPPFDFLALPRALALTLMMPLLYIYAAAISIFGGMLVASGVLGISPLAYLDRMVDAVALRHFYLGSFKSLCFGALIGLVSCHIGLRAGRSAAAVGLAATRAVVISIVGVIMVDSLFAITSSLLRY